LLRARVKNLKEGEQLFFQDESTFYQSGLARRMWARKGSRPILPIYGTRAKLNVFGIINPITGKSHFQYIKQLDADCFIAFLKLIMKEYKDAGKIYLIIDNAPGHRAKKVKRFLEGCKDKLEVVELPPYCPDLNDIETVWREVKKDVVYNTFYPLFQEFKDALTSSLRDFNEDRIKSICNFQKYGISIS
jgi:transposase